MVALTWYSLSYIPYGRQLFQRFILPVLKPVIKVVRAAFSNMRRWSTLCAWLGRYTL